MKVHDFDVSMRLFFSFFCLFLFLDEEISSLIFFFYVPIRLFYSAWKILSTSIWVSMNLIFMFGSFLVDVDITNKWVCVDGYKKFSFIPYQ